MLVLSLRFVAWLHEESSVVSCGDGVGDVLAVELEERNDNPGFLFCIWFETRTTWFRPVLARLWPHEKKLKQFNPPLSKACWACIDALKQVSLQHKGTHSEKGHKVFTLRQKLKKGYQQARSVHQELPRYASFSYTNLCLAVTTLPPRAKGTPCSDSRPLGSITQLPSSMHSSHHIPLLSCNATLASSKSTASSDSDFIAAASAALLPKVSSSA